MSLRHPEKWPVELLGALEPVMVLLEDDSVTEIEANGYNDVYAKGSGWRGHKLMEGIGWHDLEDFRIACVRISDVIRRRISAEKPLLNGRLPGGERVNIAITPACERLALTIRKFPAETMTLDKLLEFESINQDISTMASGLVISRKSIIVSGGTGSGKTSTVNALSRLIPKHERIVTIEDAKELQIQQPNWVSMETVEPYAEGVPPVTIADLVKNSLRQTPDRIIVGEVRGDEALYLLRSFSSGHGGGFGTVHCNDAEDALHMLQFLAQLAPISLAASAIGLLVGRAVDVVMHQHYFDEEDGKRRISEIIEVEHPNGAVILPNGTVEFHFRRLVEWDMLKGDWVFPQSPSKVLQRTIQRRGLPWPKASLEAPSQAPLREEI